MIQETSITKQYFLPFKLKKCDNESPDMPQFKSHKLNVFVMTRNGRPVFSRYGNQIKCSSFLATFSAITGKITKFYSDNPETETMHKINHGKMTLYLIKRKCINVLCISKSTHDELQILAAMDFVNMQLISCFTDKLNAILLEKQGYDPTSSFNPTTVNLLSSAVKNALHSPCMFLNSIPVMPLATQYKSQLLSMMKDIKIESMQVFLLMTLTQVVGVLKRKEIDLFPEDVLLLFNLFHTQKALRNTKNWFPICLPGIEQNGQLFCYSNFITEHLVVIMLTDEPDAFDDFNQGVKTFKDKIVESDVNKRINSILSKPQVMKQVMDKNSYIQHFLVKNNELNQLVMSDGNYFGHNSPALKRIICRYAKIHRIQSQLSCNKKQKIQYQNDEEGVVCQYIIGNFTILFAAREIVNLEGAKNILQNLYKWVKDDETLFIYKSS